MCMDALTAYMFVPEGGIKSPETRVTNTCELSCGYREFNPGPLEKQHVFLTLEPSPLLQSIKIISKVVIEVEILAFSDLQQKLGL